LAGQRGDVGRAQRWRSAADGWRRALMGQAWDGQWFKRAFFDDGSPLGTHANPEARIDLIAQAWAVLSKGAPAHLQRMAMAAVRSQLFDADAGLIRLLDPPLQHAMPSAGYIQAYPPGVRENGGQYTHAAAWYALAQFVSGNADLGYEALRILNPAEKSLDISDLKTYRLEPYALAGDVYAAAGAEGRGGWSLYTGSAGWYYRVMVEYMLGIKRRGNILYFEPRLPSDWDSYSARLLLQKTRVNLVVQRGNYDCLLVDGAPAEYVPLDGGQHNALLIIH